jgi:hypothetical protein
MGSVIHPVSFRMSLIGINKCRLVSFSEVFHDFS